MECPRAKEAEEIFQEKRRDVERQQQEKLDKDVDKSQKALVKKASRKRARLLSGVEAADFC